MDPARKKRASLRALTACLALTAVFTLRAEAYGAGRAPGSEPLRQARAAWDRGDVSAAEPFYRQALEAGGLAPSEVLEGYVRLGAARAAVGKKDQALAAFRAASILDPAFAVPPEAGPKAGGIAARARQDTASVGGIQLSMDAPHEAPSGKPVAVVVKLDAAHVSIVNKLVLVVRDGTSGKETTVMAPSETNAELEVPSSMTLPGAELVLRADALDNHQNRLASVEERLRIGGGASAQAAPSKASSSSEKHEATSKSGGNFWSTPWPYIIGGIALAGAGTAVYYGTRPPDQVSVGQVNVQPR